MNPTNLPLPEMFASKLPVPFPGVLSVPLAIFTAPVAASHHQTCAMPPATDRKAIREPSSLIEIDGHLELPGFVPATDVAPDGSGTSCRFPASRS